MRTTTFATAAVVALTLVLSTTASAQTFCVHSTVSCNGTPAATLGSALATAAANGQGRDTIQLPAGTINDLPVWDQAGNPVDIVGAGPDATILTAATGGALLGIDEPTSTVSQLQVRITGSAGAIAFSATKGASFDHVKVSADGSQASATAFDTHGGTTSITDSSVDLHYTPTTYARGIQSYNFSSVSITRSSITAEQAVHMQESSVNIEQSQIWAHQGIETITGGYAFVRNSTIRTPGPTPHDGDQYGVLIGGADPQELDLLQSTIYGDFAPGSAGIVLHPYSDPTASGVAFLTDSVIAHYGTTADLNGTDGPVALYAAWSAFDPTRISGNGTFGHANNVDLIERSAGFVDPDAGDLHLRPDSPLVDAADPTATSSGVSDRDGNPRISNNRVDIGALEYQYPAPVPAAAVADAPATGTPPDAPSGGGGVTSVAATPTAIGPLVEKLRLAPATFRVRGSRPSSSAGRVATGSTLSFRLSQRATVTVMVQRAMRRRWTRVGSFTLKHAAGLAKVRFDGRVHHRALRAGRYRLRVVARNAAGLASKAAVARFRIVR